MNSEEYELLLARAYEDKLLHGRITESLWTEISRLIVKEVDHHRIDKLFGILQECTLKTDLAYYNLYRKAEDNWNVVVMERALRLAIGISKRRGRKLGYVMYSTKLAQMIIRKQVEYPEKALISEAISLLIPGVRSGNKESIIFMAMTFAQYNGSVEDWKIAYKLIQMLEDKKDAVYYNYLFEHGISGKREGNLALLMLLKAGKININELGKYEEIYAYVNKEYPLILDNFDEGFSS